MVDDIDTELDLIFHALSDRTRRDILKRLSCKSMGISELASTYDMSLTAVSKHVKVLERALLVVTTKEGRVHRCSMQFESVQKAYSEIAFYKTFWEEQLGKLDDYVQDIKRKKSSRGEM